MPKWAAATPRPQKKPRRWSLGRSCDCAFVAVATTRAATGRRARSRSRVIGLPQQRRNRASPFYGEVGSVELSVKTYEEGDSYVLVTLTTTDLNAGVFEMGSARRGTSTLASG